MTGMLLGLLARSLVLGTIGLGLALALRRGSAARRHLVCIATLATLLALPALVPLLPRAAVPVPIKMPAPLVPATNPAVLPPEGADAPTVPKAAAPLAPQERINLGALAVTVWLVGAAILLLRLGGGLIRAGLWIRHGTPVSPSPSELPCGTRLLLSAPARVPMTFWRGGHFVLLPHEAATWEASRLRSALLHEAAHIRRGDWFSLVLALVCRALYWPNPLVWLLTRESVAAAEAAADDRVLAAGVAPSTYAEDLLRIAQRLQSYDVLTALPMARESEVRRRIGEVLNEKKNRGAVGIATLALCAASATLITLPGAMLALEFRDPNRPSARTQKARPAKDADDVELMVVIHDDGGFDFISGRLNGNLTHRESKLNTAALRNVRLLPRQEIEGETRAGAPQATLLEFRVDPNYVSDAVSVRAFDRRGKPVKMLANRIRGDRGGIHHRWYFSQTLDGLRIIEVRRYPNEPQEYGHIDLRQPKTPRP